MTVRRRTGAREMSAAPIFLPGISGIPNTSGSVRTSLSDEPDVASAAQIGSGVSGDRRPLHGQRLGRHGCAASKPWRRQRATAGAPLELGGGWSDSQARCSSTLPGYATPARGLPSKTRSRPGGRFDLLDGPHSAQVGLRMRACNQGRVANMARLDGKVAAVTGGASGMARRRSGVRRRGRRWRRDRDATAAAAWRPSSGHGRQVAFTRPTSGPRPPPRLRQRCGAAVRAPRRPRQQCRHPQIREDRRGERGELERNARRQPDELRLLCQGGRSADAPQTKAAPSSTSPPSVPSSRAAAICSIHDQGGIAGLTRALAADHSPEGIRVNAVGPGPIFTPFHERRIRRPARPSSNTTPRRHAAPC